MWAARGTPHHAHMSNTTTSTPTANPNKALWEKGDFTRIADTMRASGDAFIQRIGVRASHTVLDLGCGDGTTAIPAAQLGANVRGVDIAANLVAAGRARATHLGLANCTFEEGDASNLQAIDDASFDMLVTVFGAMFAPRPHDTAAEMVRVVKPGGHIVMGNWIPGDPTLVAQILRISGSYSPPPPDGFISPVTWGVEDHVRDRFTAAGVPADRIRCERDTWVFDFAGTPQEFVGVFRDFYGPTMNAFAAATANGKAADLQAELEELFVAQNTSTTADRTVIPATFLRVTVER
jgi:SAM-dependent methyltransferase